jgi:hypothetical protein
MWGGVNGGEVIGEVCLKRFLILFCFVITAQKILERTDLMVLAGQTHTLRLKTFSK